LLEEDLRLAFLVAAVFSLGAWSVGRYCEDRYATALTVNETADEMGMVQAAAANADCK
jgi:hypothetical protein